MTPSARTTRSCLAVFFWFGWPLLAQEVSLAPNPGDTRAVERRAGPQGRQAPGAKGQGEQAPGAKGQGEQGPGAKGQGEQAPGAAEQGARPRGQQAPKITVSAFRLEQDPFELSRSVTVADRRQIERRDRDSALDVLDREMGIWVAKRTATSSDPVIRGLSGGLILALVDGDSLTTFWGEGGLAGDDMYGKVDAESIERIEVIRGPASVEYGSNALGGVINFITRKPRLSFPDEGAVFGGRAKAGYDTVNNGMLGRLDVEAALPWLRFRLGSTWRDLDDGQGGNGVSTLSPSGGRDLNFDWNSEARAGDGVFFLNAQRVRRNDISRYYRPTQRNENHRDALSLGYRSAPSASKSGFEGRFYWQQKEDFRYFLNNGDIGTARWDSLSTDWTWRSDEWLSGHELMVGLSARQDRGESPDDEQFTIAQPNGTVTKAAPDQTWYDFALFLKDDWRIAPRWTLSGGVRFDEFFYDSTPDALYVPPSGNPEADDIEKWRGSVTGGVGLVFEPAERWRTFASWSRGFRMFAPRFGISKVGFGVLVPSGVLEPIVGDSFEVGVRHRSELVDTSLVGYYTRFDGFQNIVPGTYQGRSFYDYNRNGSFEPDEQVYVTSGNGKAFVGGAEWEARLEMHELWKPLPLGSYASMGFMWNLGKDETNDEPLRQTHPARGLFALGYEDPVSDRWYCEVGADFVDRFTDISSSRLNSDVGYRKDPQEPSSPPLRDYGLPGYTAVYLEAGARIGDHWKVGANIDNLTNKNYRPAHARMDAFGFSLGVFVEAEF
ncbi:MAG: TonB-dependent hemoglobin/transferrin/lactoferrin family receptor [Planctomycetota bacterium]